MLIISNEMVFRLLTMDEVIDAQEAAFAQLDSGRSIHRPRVDMYVPCQRDDGYFRWGTMEGANDGYFAIRMKSDIIHWPRGDDGSWTSPLALTLGFPSNSAFADAANLAFVPLTVLSGAALVWLLVEWIVALRARRNL